jgi:hypothetical protein
MEKFTKSIDTQGPDWEYRNLAFDYLRNSYGHRSIEFMDMDSSNYILCAGCSVTEGIGIPVQYRYGDVLANLLSCGVYNLGIGGTGNDIIFYNLVTWFSTIKFKPKLVIIQWTGNTRFSTIADRKMIVSHGSWNKEDHDFLVNGDTNRYFVSKTEMMKQLLRNMIDVPVIEIPWLTDDEEDLSGVQHSFKLTSDHSIDLARDLMHPGIKSNHSIANSLFKYIQSTKLI